MYRLFIVWAACLLLAAPSPAQVPVKQPPDQVVVEELPNLTPEEELRLAPYLTKEGFLTGALEVRDELDVFGTFFGTIWRIEPDGRWTITRIYRKIPILIGQGQLTKKQVREVAKRLVPFDPLTLANLGRPLVNPHTIMVSFKSNTAVWTLGVDQIPSFIREEDLQPSPAPGLSLYVVGKTPTASGAVLVVDPSTRFAGIQSILKGMIQPNLGVQMDLPLRLKQLGHP